MSDCICIPNCVFFQDKMAAMPEVANSMKRRYCKGDYSRCARWRVREKLGPAHVPPDLFPNQKERADKLVSGAE